jgi:hypothetical protein
MRHGLAGLAATLRARRLGETAYLDRMIHFWREISLAAFPCAGKAMDECYALLFESTFSLAHSEPVWAIDCLTTQPPVDCTRQYPAALRTPGKRLPRLLTSIWLAHSPICMRRVENKTQHGRIP